MVEAGTKGALMIGALPVTALNNLTASLSLRLTGPVVGARGRKYGICGMFWALEVRGLLRLKVGSGAVPRALLDMMGLDRPNLHLGIESSSFPQ